MSFQDYESAKNQFLKAIEINSDEWFTFQTHIKLGICYKELGKFKLAIEEFLKTIELDPNSWYVYQTYIKLGICYRELEDYELALEHLTKGEELIDQSLSDNDTKQMWHSYAKPFIEETKVLLEDF